MTRADTRQCTNSECVGDRHQIREMLRILRPSLMPGGSPVDALQEVLRKAQLIHKQRNAYMAAVQRAQALAGSSVSVGRSTVYLSDLAHAVQVRPEDLR